MSVSLIKNDNVSNDFDVPFTMVNYYDENHAVKVEVTVDEDPSTFAFEIHFGNVWPTFENVNSMAFDYMEQIGLTANTIQVLRTNEW